MPDPPGLAPTLDIQPIKAHNTDNISIPDVNSYINA